MTGRLPGAVLLAAADADASLLGTFPLEAVADALAGETFDQELQLPVTLTQARTTVRRMSVEKAAFVARWADADEGTFTALWVDRRITVRRHLAVNPRVPSALRQQWLDTQADRTKPLDGGDTVANALVAGILAEGWPADGLETVGLDRLLADGGSHLWPEILEQMPAAALWATIRGGDFEVGLRMRLLQSCSGRMRPGERPTPAEMAVLLEQTMRSGNNWGGGGLSGWFGDMVVDALTGLPEDLAGEAYEALGNLSRIGWSRQNLRILQDGRSRRQGLLLRRVLDARAAGRHAPLPRRIDPAHLLEHDGENRPLHVDDPLLDALAAGMPLFGDSLEGVSDLRQRGGRILLDRLDEQTWEERLQRLRRSRGRDGESIQQVKAASLAVLLADDPQLPQLPKSLLAVCAAQADDLQVLLRLLESGQLSVETLTDRLTRPDAGALNMTTLFALIRAGHLTLEDILPAVSVHALPHLAAYGRGLDGQQEWTDADAAGDTDHIAGLQASFRQLRVEKRLLLLAGLRQRPGSIPLAVWSEELGYLLQESLHQPAETLRQQLEEVQAQHGSASETLATALMLTMLHESGKDDTDRPPHTLGDLLPDPVREKVGRGMARLLGELTGSLPADQLNMLLERSADHLTPAALLSLPTEHFAVGALLRQLLGTDPAAWQLFASMAAEWRGSVPQLAAAIRQLT